MRLVTESLDWLKDSSSNKTLLTSKVNGCSMIGISNSAEISSWQR
jgi:hypothetical protein